MKGFSLGIMIFFALILTSCGTKDQDPNLSDKEPHLSDQDNHLFDNPRIDYTFIVVGDTQPPTTEDQMQLINKIISERPDFVIHAGDFVDIGTEEEWQRVDNTFGRVMDAGIPVYPVLGNHEYANAGGRLSDTEDKMKLYFDRFPHLKGNKWYSFKYGNITFIMLDSTHMHFLEKEDWDSDPQVKWYKTAIDRTGMKIVTIHHPMVTYSGAGAEIQEVYMRMLLKEAIDTHLTSALVFSGHIHNFQAINDGKMYYIVTGGGAGGIDGKGTPISYNTIDGYELIMTYRPHYVKAIASEDRLDMEVLILDKENHQWVKGKKLTATNISEVLYRPTRYD